MRTPRSQGNRSSRRTNRRLLSERLENRLLLAGNSLQAVGNAGSYTPYDPQLFTEHNGATYFFAADPMTGFELWRTDESDAGTVRITDNLPTPDVNYFRPVEMVSTGTRLFFTLGQYSFAHQLWTSDGTAAGTVLVKQFSEFGSEDASGPSSLTAAAANVYFVADDGVHGTELWVSDGTMLGTVMVADIGEGAAGANPQSLTALENNLYFSADDGVHGVELWSSDGTAEGTVLLEIRPGELGSTPKHLTVFDNSLYLSADNGVSGSELWRTDNSSASPELVVDLNPGEASSNPHQLTPFAGALWFAADDGTSGNELWKTEVNSDIAVLVKDILPGPGSSDPDSLTVTGNLLYFTADDGNGGASLWRSDGSPTETVNAVPGFGRTPLVGLNGILLYVTNQSDSGLWKSDGTPAGTERVQQFSGYTRLPYVPAGSSTALFDSHLPNGPFALWKTDGTEQGTTRLKQELPEFTQSMAAAENGAYFSAVDRSGERGLWFSDGSSEGTHRIGTVRVASEYFFWPGPTGPTVVASDNIAYFTGIDANGNHGLWRSDGTVEGTIHLTNSLYSPAGLVRFGNAIYFPSSHGVWKLADGQVTLEQIWYNTTSQLSPAGDFLYFLQGTPGDWQTLTRTDGTLQGTLSLTTARIESLVSYQGAVYFFRETYSSPELWTSDGTEAGTARVDANLPSYFDGGLYASGGWLYLLLNDGLYRSDGTAGGTQRFADLYFPPVTDKSSVEMASIGDETYFYAVGTQNDGLYKTDGTPQGTFHLAGRVPLEMTPVGDQLYFVGTDVYQQKRRLWKSDGTAAGTIELTIENSSEFAPADIHHLQVVGGLLFMSATRSYDSGYVPPMPSQLWVDDFRTPGDANNDSQVDGADYTVWANHFLTAPTSSLPFNQGDFNRDGVIDGADYTLWANNFSPLDVASTQPVRAQEFQSTPAVDADRANDEERATIVDHVFESALEQSGDLTAAVSAVREAELNQHWLGWLALAADVLAKPGQTP